MSEEKRVRSMWEKNTKTMYLKAKCFKVQREDVVGLQ